MSICFYFLSLEVTIFKDQREENDGGYSAQLSNCKLQIMDWYFIDHFTLTEYGKLPVVGPSTRKHQKNKPNYKPPPPGDMNPLKTPY